MQNKLLVPFLLIILVGSIGWMIDQKKYSTSQIKTDNQKLIVLHKDPYCSCCGSWGSYMEEKGYQISTILEEDMSLLKNNLGVPYELGSCHTSEIDGYVVEGHIPNEAIEKLLLERPDIKGIGMAGMPSGSPGMPGPKADFLIYEINHDGTKGDLFMEL